MLGNSLQGYNWTLQRRLQNREDDKFEGMNFCRFSGSCLHETKASQRACRTGYTVDLRDVYLEVLGSYQQAIL